MQHTRTRHLLLTALLILVTACNASPSGSASGPTPTPIPPGPDLEQPTYTVQRGTVARSLKFTTCVAPIQEAELFFRADRHLSRLLVQRDRPIPESKVLVLTACQFSPDMGPPVFGQDGPLAEMAQGWDSARIAGESCLAEQMVTNYVSRIHAGLGVSSRAEATVWAREHGLGVESNRPLQTAWACSFQGSTPVPNQQESTGVLLKKVLVCLYKASKMW